MRKELFEDERKTSMVCTCMAWYTMQSYVHVDKYQQITNVATTSSI